MKLEQALKTSKFTSNRHKVGLNILYTAWWMKTIINTNLKQFGLTHEQYNVLRILKGKHPEQMCVKDIASRMIEKNSNVPRIIDKLFLKLFIQRIQSDIDGRQTMISLTKAGLEILDNTTKHINQFESNINPLTEEEAHQLNNLLEKIRAEEE
ncbi:MAG TPA: MarR family transcriptional regulator [Flavipsychrobacter sp.]|jgi:DNA-binding MarR family transcriptional regulator|nr:MarR family transcriptional regulator [Flavipsychrobacter sp.]